MNTFKKLINDESGATAIEYGLLAALIGVAIIAGSQAIGNQLDTLFGDVKTCLEGATGQTSCR